MLKAFIVVLLLCNLTNTVALNAFGQALRSLKQTDGQRAFANHLRSYSENMNASKIVVVSGPAGSGKTSLSVLHALDALKAKRTNKVILTRPSVLIDNDAFGALPGGVEEKMDPLLSHIADIVGEATSSVISSTWTLTKQHAIKVVPLEYTRGLTFHDSFVVADEMQNSTPRQMLSLLTRVGRGCTMVITGDLAQSDINEANGLQDFIDKMVIAQRHDDCNLKSIVHVELTKDDVMRSDIVKEILSIYEL